MPSLRALPFFAALLAAVAASGAAHAGYDQIDSDGCWDGLTPRRAQCLVLDSSEMKADNQFVSRWKNTCPERILVQFCNEKADGRWDCGMDGIRPDSVKSWSTYKATGRYSASAIGATKPDMDWVCSDRFKGWKRH